MKTRHPRYDRGQGRGYLWLLARMDHAGNECLMWPYTLGTVGYGQVGINGKVQRAHRLMCQLAHGKPPSPRHQAAHSCGNGPKGCVNPNHLSWKTNSENQRDRRKHGTQNGSKGSRTPLSAAQIAEIRRLKGVEDQISIAKRMGVKRGCVQYWQTHDRPPKPPGTSRHAIKRRARAYA